jgi:predicted amidohydrolase YtcJ
MEKEKGTLTPGKLADCAVPSEDLTQIPPDKIKEIQVEMTIVGGNIVFSKMPL